MKGDKERAPKDVMVGFDLSIHIRNHQTNDNWLKHGLQVPKAAICYTKCSIKQLICHQLIAMLISTYIFYLQYLALTLWVSYSKPQMRMSVSYV